MRARSPARRLAAGLALALVAGLLGPSAGLGMALYGDADTSAATFSTAACFPGDTTPPTVDGTVISKSVQYLPGYVRQGGQYQVYASVSDGDCGIVSTVRADVSALTAGQTALILPAGTFAVGGVGYGRRSNSMTVRNPLTEGTYSYSISATDAAGNSQTSAGFTVIVDNTRPAGVDVQAVNGGPTPGKPEAGDSVTYTFSDVIDPQSILGGWTGAPIAVVARMTNNGSADRLTIRNPTNTGNLPLGTVNLRGNYVAGTRLFGATGTPSTMTTTGTTITVTFGSASGATLTSAVPAAMTWPPSSTAADRAGNTCLTTTVTESAPLDVEF